MGSCGGGVEGRSIEGARGGDIERGWEGASFSLIVREVWGFGCAFVWDGVEEHGQIPDHSGLDHG